MRIRTITSLGRAVDPAYRTNRAITLLALVAAAAMSAFRILSGDPPPASLSAGAAVGFALFLTWAVARELDPAHDLSAFVGVGLAPLGMLFLGTPSLLLVLWLLLALRLVNRTVGLPATPLDSLAVLGLGTWLSWQGDWLVAPITALAFLLDGLLAPPLRYHLVFSILSFAAAGIMALWRGQEVPARNITLPLTLALALTSLLFGVVIATTREVQATGDATGEPLNPARVRAAQILTLLAASLYVVWGGEPGAVALLPVWASMAGVGLYRLVFLFVHGRQF